MPDAKRLQDMYKEHWEKAANDCKYVKATLEHEFPGIDIFPGHGALSSDYEYGKHERGSADLYVFKDDIRICAIEVTGSDRMNINDNNMIWLRPDKIEYMRNKRKEYPVFAWLIYKNAECILNLPLIDEHQKGDHVHYPRGQGYPETYTHIPFKEALPTDWVISFIKDCLKYLEENQEKFTWKINGLIYHLWPLKKALDYEEPKPSKNGTSLGDFI